MNDELIFNNYLLLLKSTVEVYVHGTLESSNDSVLKCLKHGLNETMNHQAIIYNEMAKCGWYSINNVDSSSIKKVLSNIS